MKLSVLALDYDGTIARDDRLDSSVRDAIADARRRGIAVMLVTGRNLVDLRRVAGDLHFVDGVVAENGALLHFPDSGVTTPLSPPVSPAFLAGLRERGIPFQAGQSIVDADAAVDRRRRCGRRGPHARRHSRARAASRAVIQPEPCDGAESGDQ